MWSGGFDGNTPSYSWTCGGIHQAAYLDTIVHLTIATGTPALISDNIGGEINTESLRKALSGENGSTPVLICQDNKLLRVLSCYDKNRPVLASTTDPTYEPANPIACPAAWRQQDTCSQNTLHITGL
ncbi:hypothetical protein THRCLA_21620 [Thraustotheca clavata]|uniref:Uncharacterized protein n=1 Tax=Thraustotheca clavata TaxID=74557 RepID=A0A1V9ZUY9_9STRA|nr:hypothetical protein THRCLA_21620 [Thraustotheca clavata]